MCNRLEKSTTTYLSIRFHSRNASPRTTGIAPQTPGQHFSPETLSCLYHPLRRTDGQATPPSKQRFCVRSHHGNDLAAAPWACGPPLRRAMPTRRRRRLPSPPWKSAGAQAHSPVGGGAAKTGAGPAGDVADTLCPGPHGAKSVEAAADGSLRHAEPQELGPLELRQLVETLA